MAFVPAEFAVPRRLRTPLFDLSPLGPQHAEADYDAVMSSRCVDPTQSASGWGHQELY